MKAQSQKLETIGVIHTPFSEQRGTPIQPIFAGDKRGEVVVEAPYRPALQDLDGFERIWLLYVFHAARHWEPLVTPYLDERQRGLFATRAPSRPVPIGMSAVRLIAVKDDRLIVEGVDMLDGTPLVDIKPYVPEFDAFPESAAGWHDSREGLENPQGRADDRFED